MICWLRHRDVKVTEQKSSNIELNVNILSWLSLFQGCDFDGDCGLITVKKSGSRNMVHNFQKE